jgi:hypothetical protein
MARNRPLGLGGKRMAGDVKSVTPRPKLQFNGKISAIHRQLIGNAMGRREEREVNAPFIHITLEANFCFNLGDI